MQPIPIGKIQVGCLVRDHEWRIDVSEQMIDVAMGSLLLKRLFDWTTPAREVHHEAVFPRAYLSPFINLAQLRSES
jgi:hypothetical protein